MAGIYLNPDINILPEYVERVQKAIQRNPSLSKTKKFYEVHVFHEENCPFNDSDDAIDCNCTPDITIEINNFLYYIDCEGNLQTKEMWEKLRREQ